MEWNDVYLVSICQFYKQPLSGSDTRPGARFFLFLFLCSFWWPNGAVPGVCAPFLSQFSFDFSASGDIYHRWSLPNARHLLHHPSQVPAPPPLSLTHILYVCLWLLIPLSTSLLFYYYFWMNVCSPAHFYSLFRTYSLDFFSLILSLSLYLYLIYDNASFMPLPWREKGS